MIQSMEILQLAQMALCEKIEQECIENPVLEMQEVDPEPGDEADRERESPDAPTDSEKEMVVDDPKDNSEDFERLLEMDRELPDYFDEGPRRSANRMDEEADRKHDAIANIETRPQTLRTSQYRSYP